MAITTKSISSVLNSLIETCKDGQHGFATAAEDVKDASLKSLFEELSMERRRFVDELQHLVRSVGEEVEQSGSVAGAVHRAWIDMKSAISSGSKHAILAECERGEDSAVAEYREALEHDLPAQIRTVVQQQYVSVQQAHDRVRDLRDAFEE
jgi:uncharacterized protein (TIGR02284 family)